MRLDSIAAEIILDSRREKTIETTLTSKDFVSKASVPCGKSKGDYEAFSYPAERSLEIIAEITPSILGKDYSSQAYFDSFLLELDGSKNKNRLGVDITLSLSIAFIRLFSLVNNKEVHQTVSDLAGTTPNKFPLLFFNLINGGLHVDKSYCPLPFQEYMVIPKTNSPKESLNLVFKFIELLKKGITDVGFGVRYGDEGGFVITGEDPELGLQYFQDVVKTNRDVFENKVFFGLDVASSTLWDKKDNIYSWNNRLTKCSWNNEQLSEIYQSLVKKYPLLSIEDPFHQDSWEEWARLNQSIGKSVWLIGDDLTVTNVERIKKAQKEGSANAVLIKPNQIGTIIETIEAVKLAKSYGWKIVVSHRSGETNDTFIADLAFGVSADGFKSGSPLQTERLAKYKRLLQIEDSYQELNVR